MEGRCSMSICTSIGTIYAKDSLTFLVTVTDEDTGQPLDLAPASLELVAESRKLTIEGTVEVEGPSTAGQVACTFPKESFLGYPGTYTSHLRVTIGTEVQTVAIIKFTIKPSIVITP